MRGEFARIAYEGLDSQKSEFFLITVDAPSTLVTARSSGPRRAQSPAVIRVNANVLTFLLAFPAIFVSAATLRAFVHAVDVSTTFPRPSLAIRLAYAPHFGANLGEFGSFTLFWGYFVSALRVRACTWRVRASLIRLRAILPSTRSVQRL